MTPQTKSGIESEGRGRSAPRWVLWAGIVLAAAVVGGVLIGLRVPLMRVFELEASSSQLDKWIARAEQAGFPMTADAVDQRPDPPTGKNAWPEVQRLVAAQAALEGQSSSPAEAGQDHLGSQDIREGRMAATASLLAAAESAADEEAYKPDYDFDKGPLLQMPEPQALRSAAAALSSRVLLKARQGDVDGALNDSRRMNALARFAGGDPTFAGFFSSNAIRQSELTTMHRTAVVWAGNDAKLARLEEYIQGSDYEPDMLLPLRGEFFLGLTLARNVDIYEAELEKSGPADAASVPPTNLKRSGLPETMVERAHLAHFASQVLGMREILEADTQGLDEKLERLERLENSEVVRTSPVASLTRLMDTKGSLMLRTAALLEANQGALLGLVRAMRQRAATGKWPASVGELGKLPMDPFDGRPLKVGRLAGEFRVYSLGLAGRDLGGVFRDDPGRQERHSVNTGYGIAVTAGS